MSHSEGNAKGRSLTLHVVSSLDGFIARKDNSVSWLDITGSVYEAGVSISEEEAATSVKAIDDKVEAFTGIDPARRLRP